MTGHDAFTVAHPRAGGRRGVVVHARGGRQGDRMVSTDAERANEWRARAVAAEAALVAVTEERDAWKATAESLEDPVARDVLIGDEHPDVVRLTEERDRLRDALSFYADPSTWQKWNRSDGVTMIPAVADNGARARAVLSDPTTPEPCEACGQTLVQGFIPVVGGGTHRHPDYPELEFARCPVCGGTGVISDPTTPEAS